jgi:hypothetical protein
MASGDVEFVEASLSAWLERTSRGDPGGASPEDEARRFFVPTREDALAASHLAHRLELARRVAAGAEERVAALGRRLDDAAAETRRAEEDLALARRRAHVAERGRSTLAAFPLGLDAGAAPSVHDADGAALARDVFEASATRETCDAYAAALERRSALVTEELLRVAGGGDGVG